MAGKATPTVSVPTLAPVSPITLGASVTASVTVSGSAGTPTGTVTFQVSTDSGTTWNTLGAVKTLATGSATSDSYTPAAVGAYQFRAQYGGDSNYNGATGDTVSLTVNPIASGVDHFVFGAISGAKTAGTAFSITITAQDSSNHVVTGYASSVGLTASTGSTTISPTATGTSGWSNGVWTGNVQLTKTGSGITITANDGSSHTGISGGITVIQAHSQASL